MTNRERLDHLLDRGLDVSTCDELLASLEGSAILRDSKIVHRSESAKLLWADSGGFARFPPVHCRNEPFVLDSRLERLTIGLHTLEVFYRKNPP